MDNEEVSKDYVITHDLLCHEVDVSNLSKTRTIEACFFNIFVMCINLLVFKNLQIKMDQKGTNDSENYVSGQPTQQVCWDH